MSEQFDRSFSLVVGCRHCESLGSSSMYLGGQLTVGNIDGWPCSRAQRSTVPRGARPALKSTVQTPDLFKTATVRRVACAVGPAPSFSSMRAHKIQASASCVACACIPLSVRGGVPLRNAAHCILDLHMLAFAHVNAIYTLGCRITHSSHHPASKRVHA